MLRDSWIIGKQWTYNGEVNCFFVNINDKNVSISIKAPTEYEAWEKLGALLGKEDKENVETEVFEGVVKAYDYYDIIYPNLETSDGYNLIQSLMEYENKNVEVTIRIKP